jgi:hypothetical protein
MLKLLINNGDGNGLVDYTRYVIMQSIDVEDSINTPTLLSFTLANTDGAFKIPVRSAYVQLVSTLSPLSATGAYLATGYITNEIQRKFLGGGGRAAIAQRFQHYEYDVKVTSDEYLLNTKATPFIAAYINRTMGQILTDLTNVLAPGFFDTSGIQAGDLVPFFQYNPENKWSDTAKEFADQAQYRYKVIGKKIFFVPYGDQPLSISYNELTQPAGLFAPSALETGILSVPLVNDAIVIGEVEPQQMRDDYFVGDGFSANFPLRYKMFHGTTDLLLQDDWTEQQLNSSLWTEKDPFGQFVLAGALNCVSLGGASGALGLTYLLGKNGVELGGHLVLQHGEIQFNDKSTGIVGGIYQNVSNLNAANCIAGFNISNGSVVTVTASGANGIVMQPMISGALVGTPVTSVQNHHYVLQTYVSARRWSRYNQIYRTLAGTAFGDNLLPSSAEVTFTITDIDLAQAYNIATLNNPFVPQYRPTITRYTSVGLSIPSFGAYVILNSQALNLTLNYTMLWQPPTASLQVAGISGAMVTNVLALTGGQMPVYDPADPLASEDSTAIGPLQNFPMGFGINQDITGTITQAGDYDQLSFYSDRIPGVGAKIRVQAWQAGHAVSRVQDPTSIAREATIVGDNGLRSAIISDLKPDPRTSDECDLAAAAVITDRENPQFDGSYVIESQLWDSTKGFPISGRYLNVTAPQRNISGQQFLVRQVKTTILEMFSEIYMFQVSFGQDLYLEKLLRRFVDQPQNVLEPTDTANPPDPQLLPPPGTVFTTFLDNLQNAKATLLTGTQVLVDLGAPPITGVEVRRSDNGWASSATNLVGVFTTQQFTLPRAANDQTWYMRQVNGSQTSRFTRALRVNYPMVPTAPSSVSFSLVPAGKGLEATVTGVLPQNFDKNIYGFQVQQYYDLASPSAITFSSSNALDTRQVTVYGVDSSGNVLSSTVTLNGTSNVATGLSTFSSLDSLSFSSLTNAGNVSVQSGPTTLAVAPATGANFQLSHSLYKYANLTLAFSPNDPGLSYQYRIDPSAFTSRTLATNFFNLLNERSQPFVLDKSQTAANTPVIFEPPLRMCLSGLPELWIVRSSKDPAYIGSLSYMSTDGTLTFHPIKDLTGSEVIFGNATTGITISGDFPAHIDVDADDQLVVDLSESDGAGVLASYIAADRDNFRYPCYVGTSGALLSPGWLSSVSGQAGYTNYAGIEPADTVAYQIPSNCDFGLVGCHTRGSYMALWGNGIGGAPQSNSTPCCLGSCGQAAPGPGSTGTIITGNGPGCLTGGISPCSQGGQTPYLVGAFQNLPPCGCPTCSLVRTAVGGQGNIISDTSQFFLYDFESNSVGIKNTAGYGGVVSAKFFGSPTTVGPLTFDDVTFPANNSLSWQSVGFGGAGGVITIVKMLPKSVGYPLYVAFVMGAFSSNPPSVPGWTQILSGVVDTVWAAYGPSVEINGNYELIAYLNANSVSGNTYVMPAASGGGGPIRRAVFSQPFAGVGEDHPIGSRFAWLNDRLLTKPAGIIKIPLDPAWIGQTLYFKLPAISSAGGIEKLSSAQTYAYVPTGNAFSQFSSQPTYVQTPLQALTQADANTINVASVTESFAGNLIKYNARTFTIPTPPAIGQTYYVSIYDPHHLGDVGAALTRTAYIDTTQTRLLSPGYVYVGSIVALPSGFSMAVVTPGGWPPGQVLLVNGV